ncbi:Transmembrane protein [Thalictrum thalictroides]|uniref:Transmembrane protein n=1 Tax=Thalictrum thalictroides TaxID=46969 RepID=A0A7J6UXS2_THATH|nr:Transmembrane protein [Thalictrum thalictroides]
MDWKKWIQSGERVFSAPILREPFYIFTINLLSLLLPLSFLLVSRLSRAQYVLSSYDPSQSDSFLLFLFLYTNPTLLHILVSFVSINALLHGLTGKFALPKVVTSPVLQPRLYTAWILLCTLQVCVGLGIEGSIAAGIWTIDNDVVAKSIFLVRFIFFIGLHETMVHWTRTFVKPVVDDTVFGGPRNTWWVEKLVMGASFGVLWWWRLRDEVEGLLLVVQLKREVLMGLAITDLVNWWLYYLTVTLGVVRLVRGFLWLGEVLLCKRRLEGNNGFLYVNNDDKV